MQLTKHWAARLDEYVIDLSWSPDGTTLAAAAADGPVALFATLDGSRRHTLPGHEGGTNTLAWAPGSRTGGDAPPTPTALATGGQDGTVKFWDPIAGQHTATAALGAAWVDHLAWWRTADRLPADEPTPAEAALRNARATSRLAAAAGRNLNFLQPDGSLAHLCQPAPKTITAIAVKPGGGCVAVAYYGGICLWDADDFVVQKEFPYANGIHALTWSPDGRWLVSGNQDPSVHLWIPEEDVELHMSGYEGKVKHLSFDRTSRWLATSGGSQVCVWDCSGAGPEGREPRMLPHETPLCAVAFQSGFGLLASASEDGVVQLWSPERQQPLRATVRLPTAATKLVWSPDGRHLAIGSAQGALYVLHCEA